VCVCVCVCVFGTLLHAFAFVCLCITEALTRQRQVGREERKGGRETESLCMCVERGGVGGLRVSFECKCVSFEG